MKKISILLIVIVLLYGCGRKVKKEYYPNGQLKEEYEIKNDTANGIFKCYYENGSIKKEGIYKNGRTEGLVRGYYKNGQIEWEAFYKNGKENGAFREYSEDGILRLEAHYKEGKQHGIMKRYYNNEQFETEQEYKDGVRHGEARFYYLNGRLKMESIANNDTTIYYKKYNEQGELIEEFRGILVLSDSDTIQLGETYSPRIKVYGPIPEKGKIRISARFCELESGKYKKKGKYYNARVYMDEQEGELPVTPDYPGTYSYEGFVYVVDSTGKGNGKPFSKKFYVIDNKLEL